jgi:dTDP-4-dehydrorhamnose 3,5-epimerase
MTLIDEPLPGVKVLKPFVFEDARGFFVKPFHEDQLAALGIRMNVREEFYSSSSVGVLRGMHYQAPPHDHQKLIYCSHGRVMDVILDLRKDSSTFGKAVGVELSSVNRHVIYVPVGFAHGFVSMAADTCMVYKTDKVHAITHDRGILWNSIDFAWDQYCQSPIISDRDGKHPAFAEVMSPF